RNDRPAASQFVVMRKRDAGQRDVLADDGRRFFDEQLAVVADRNEPERVGDRETVSRPPLVGCRRCAGRVDQALNLQRQLVAQGDGVACGWRWYIDGVVSHGRFPDNRTNDYAVAPM